MVRCWECENRTSRPRTVVLATTATHVLRVTLCPSCYRAYYLPLVSPASGETQKVARARRTKLGATVRGAPGGS